MIDISADDYFGSAMNPASFDGLPPDITKIVEDDILAAGNSHETDQVKWDGV